MAPLWQKFMVTVLKGTGGIHSFFDNVSIRRATFDETLLRIRNVLQLIISANLQLNKDKCKFFLKSINYIGHIIVEHGLNKNTE